jgi:hypothetical protein
VIVLSAIVVVLVVIGTSFWLRYWDKNEADWKWALYSGAKNRQAVVEASIAHDPLGIGRGVIAVLGVVLQIVISLL